jgi:murein L,D-transpeptidase YcbB/YkuD
MYLGQAQFNAAGLAQALQNDARLKSYAVQFPAAVKATYSVLQYRPSWVGHAARIKELLQQLQGSGSYGLNEKDYQYNFIQALQKNNPTFNISSDSLETELRLMDAALHFYHDLANGNAAPSLAYNGLKYTPSCQDISSALANAIQQNRLAALPALLEQRSPEYVSLKTLIGQYHTTLSDSSFREIKISSKVQSSANTALLTKLYQLGIIKSNNEKISDSILKLKIKEVQQLFHLTVDGKLGPATLAALNVPLQTRLRELQTAINTTRWLYCIRQSPHVVIVNIPSATLWVYEKGKVILESRIIVGKPSTPTPTLSSKITEVILYPYWMVPYSIATKELLPAIQKNPGYINANNYQVLDRQGRIMNPYHINWQELNRSDFPYTIRQSTGCDNALGLIKMNFENPFSVYLHDTPGKKLFETNRRYYSHGCMRVEKAMDLGHLVLKNNKIAIDTLTPKGCLRNQSPIVVPADEIIPVFVLYQTAWFDAAGLAGFHEDIYRKRN